ncbi:hypothetical protein FCULG_00005209 [Fusarium culmorum]|uniref:Uncharacterized protein n=1 Tax=Fusarium culmorum TaxID=5516 RepID=A0A2T4GUA5_FUSCU|nr:hypothetical protein FCULG_00005209 [Fusarium culmorum]
MSHAKDTTTPDPKGKGKEVADPAPKSILKSPQDAPADTSQHVNFSWEANTTARIPADNRGHRLPTGKENRRERLYYDPGKDRVVANNSSVECGAYVTQDDTWDEWELISRSGQEDVPPRLAEKSSAAMSDDRAASILSEPFENTCTRLQRHLERDSETDLK